MKWEVVIGLEVHAQLSTKSKIFSGASTAFGAEPNTQASAVDLALPGVLPVLNRAVVEKAIRLGLALGSTINRINVFDRKNYFYPDLPKGYQISQLTLPIVEGGHITIQVGNAEKTIKLTRAHLEEDAGKSLHDDFAGMSGIDLNRAGTPLLEIVSEPDMRSAAEAVAYAKALHSLVTWIGICDGNMQEGSFRCDVNVSVRPEGQQTLGTRREIKNLNSFKFMEQAIKYEVQWQIEQIEDGRAIQQATVLFNPDTGETRSMRSKEDAHDYRYFPDPDLLPVHISEDWIARVQAEMPELPAAKATRYSAEYGLSAYDAKALTATLGIANYFEAVLAQFNHDTKLAANWVMGDLSAQLNRAELEINDSPVSAAQLAGLLARIHDQTVSSTSAKKVFQAMFEGEGDADSVIENKGLRQMNDAGALEKIIDEVIAANPAQTADYRAGKDKLWAFFVGQVMRASKGTANQAQLSDLLKAKLAE